jgi:hypothetical protein
VNFKWIPAFSWFKGRIPLDGLASQVFPGWGRAPPLAFRWTGGPRTPRGGPLASQASQVFGVPLDGGGQSPPPGIALGFGVSLNGLLRMGVHAPKASPPLGGSLGPQGHLSDEAITGAVGPQSNG